MICLFFFMSYVNSAVRCADGTECENSQTCCPMSDGEYGCCPYTDAVCCPDLNTCVPRHGACNSNALNYSKFLIRNINS